MLSVKPETYVPRSRIRAIVRDEVMSDWLAKAIGKAIGTMHREIEEQFAKKLAALEDGSNVFKGVWAEGTRYTRGSVVSIPALGIYRALADTDARPGGSDSWQLILKAGRDGRDGRDGTTVETPAQRSVKSHR